jgi:hypothetical protein
MENELSRFKSVLDKIILPKYNFINGVSVSLYEDNIDILVNYYIDEELSYIFIREFGSFDKLLTQIRRETASLFKMMGSDLFSGLDVRFVVS